MTTKTRTTEVTHVDVLLITDGNRKTKATARVTINDVLQLTGLKVINGADGLFVAYPLNDDVNRIFYPVDKKLRQHIEKVVLEKYESVKVELISKL